MIKHISVVNKIATYSLRDGPIICGNSGYKIEFTFDAEWDAYEKKTARFIWNDQYRDIEFTGNTCDAPIFSNTSRCEIGVYAGELRTTTAAEIECRPSVLCKNAKPNEMDEKFESVAKVYAEIAEAAAEVAKEAAQSAGGVNIVQTTGDSEIAVMSQKAVTEELNKLSQNGGTADLSNYYTKTEIDTMLGSYITDIDALVGGDE